MIKAEAVIRMQIHGSSTECFHMHPLAACAITLDPCRSKDSSHLEVPLLLGWHRNRTMGASEQAILILKQIPPRQKRYSWF